MTCCNHNCNEGRTCPERIARMEQRDGGTRIDHGQIVGYECALPAQMLCEEPKPRGWNWQLIGYIAIVIVFTAFAYLWATQP